MERMERLERTPRQDRLEVTCRRFAVLSGIRQEADDYIACVQPRSGKKGTLALLTEPAGDHPALSVEVCRIARKMIADQYVADSSLSMTGGLLGALDAANNAVLRYNYASALGESQLDSSPLVAVRAGGARARRFKVGLTAAMLRLDGTGLYLAQMSPAQAYIRHNGLLTAIPETPHWRSRSQAKPHRPQLTIIRGDEEQDNAHVDMDMPPDYMQDNLLSPSLGTAPGVESNLVYRRVEEGDLIVLVTSSLARLLDRETAEEVMSGFDVDAVTDALLDLAISHGLAQAHACVLSLGGKTSSGIDVEWSGPEIVTLDPVDDEVQVSSTVQVEDEAPHAEAQVSTTIYRPTFTIVEPPARQITTDELEEDDFRLPWEMPPLEIVTEAPELEQVDGETEEQEDPASPASLHAARRPTRLLMQHQIERPPYHAPILWEDDGEEEVGELNFDGWEDSVPSLSLVIDGQDTTDPAIDDVPVVFPWEKELSLQPLATLPEEVQAEIDGSASYPAPNLFGNGAVYTDAPASVSEERVAAPATRRFNMPRLSVPRLSMPRLPVSVPKLKAPSAYNMRRTARRVFAGIGTTAQNMLPERPFRLPRPASGGASRRTVSVQMLIALALIVVVGLLAWSVFRTVDSGKQAQVNTLLEQAKQEELLANQPGTTAGQRMELLENALDHAKQAVAADPGLVEARQFIDSVQGQLDKSRGITRLSLTLLFQFGEAPAEASGQAANGQTAQVSDIVVLGNDAFVLDKAAGRVYRCTLSTRQCIPALSAGEQAGGQNAGQPMAMTTRQGTVLVLDDKLSIYTYDITNSAWSAEQLGDADKLAKPRDIATYDGNLYLLGARQGQVSKYFNGKYGTAPEDWIKDPASVEQLSNPVAMAIDGSIYALLPDGKILAMQGGKVTGSITPKPGPSTAPVSDLFTSPETRDLYLLRSSDGSISRLAKDGQTLATFMGPASDAPMAFSGVTVDEAKGQMYLVSGNLVYQASLDGKAPVRQEAAPDTSGQAAETNLEQAEQPGVRPTAEP